MTALSYAVTDSATMLRRNLRHALRYPSLTLSTSGMPIIFLLLFVYVFGGELGAGLPEGVGYVDYVVPGILLMTAGAGAVGTAIAICSDITAGIVDRFRTMAISPSALLTGHVLGSVVQAVLNLLIVIGVALLIGFRPAAGPLEWAAAGGLMVLLTLAITWVSVALGVISKNPEAASNVVLPFQLLPILSSTFVPTSSMPTAVRWFAEYQPFAPMINTLRGLLTGGPIGNDGIIAVAWCLGITLAGYLWARRVYNRPR
ncbi:ABC transporter permease [Actinomadura craniellae]|uniref:Transport permease protein n=1 Tax=Actinomadura craniellae TaxID=2231787 RepID=A0A365GZI5_9ACTN|nr:ABC transporter permease [Actinomadura craniellae]RAY12240.1 ABC transporter permease [Actinomadura craniellae]